MSQGQEQPDVAEVAVVILNWHAAADTIQCVQAVAAWQQVRPHIWVVDNASADGSADQIGAACPQVQLLRNPSNEGFAGGTNRGLAAALAAVDCPILLLNNDATVDDGSIALLLAALQEQPDIGIVGPLLYTRRERRLIAAGSRNPVLHYKNLLTMPLSTQRVYPVDYISGSVALVRPELLRQIGLLDEAYFFTMELADLSARARRQGWQTAVAPLAAATHDLDRSARLRSSLYLYYIVRNRFRYIRKFYRLAALPLSITWALYGLLLALKLRMERNRMAAPAVWLGVLDGVCARWGGQNERVLAACHGASTPTSTPSGNPAR